MLKRLKAKEIKDSEANELFMFRFSALMDKDAKRINQENSKLKQLSEDLLKIAKSRREAAKDDTPTIKVKVI